MATGNDSDKYVKCAMCKCKYINDEEHLEKAFGYNRLKERFKCCVKCRNRSYEYSNSQKGIEARKKYYEIQGKTYNFEKLVCATCGASVCRNRMRDHEQQKGCSRNDVRVQQTCI